MELTIKELSDRLGIAYSAAQGLVAGLVVKGVCVKTGETKWENGQTRGRGSIVWRLPNTITIDIGSGSCSGELTSPDEETKVETEFDASATAEPASETEDNAGVFSLTDAETVV